MDLTNYSISKLGLLTKEEEISLAKEIESREIQIIDLILSTKFGTKVVLTISEELYNLKKPAKQLTKRDIDDKKFKETLEEVIYYLNLLVHYYDTDLGELEKLKSFILSNFEFLSLGVYFYDALINTFTINFKEKKKAPGPRSKFIKSKFVISENEYGEIIKHIKVLNKQIIDIKNIFVEKNMRLAVNALKKYKVANLESSDLVQEGIIGLIRAINKFDYKRGFRFSTYATWWIRQEITGAMLSHENVIKLPSKIISDVCQLKRLEDNCPYLSDVELAEKISIKVEDVHTYRNLVKPVWSLDAIMQTDGNETGQSLLDIFSDQECENDLIDDLTLKSDIKEVRESLNSLTPRAEKVIRLKFCIFDEFKDLNSFFDFVENKLGCVF